MAFVHECWEQAVDLNSGQPYWFNRATGASQWHPPPGWAAPAAAAVHGPGAAREASPAAKAAPAEVAAAAAAAAAGEAAEEAAAEAAGEAAEEAAAEAAAAAAAAGEAGAAQPPASAQQEGQQQSWDPQWQRQWEPGLYYRDAAGLLQGPFTVEQLREWRGMLPMDLPVLRLTEGSAAREQQGLSDEQQLDEAALQEPGAGQQLQTVPQRSGEQQPQLVRQPGVGGGRWEQLVLAELLGDGELLQRWRLEYPDEAAWPGMAPPAPAYEAKRARGTAHSLAEAVLSGLPAHDEAVALARAAAAAGRSIQEVAAWSREVDYSVTAYRVAARGRIQAGDAKESLYAEAASWANPAELEQQLARAAERRKRGLRGEELRAVKQRKAELKEKKRREWLLT
ncbi:hypothetical protein ABPG75_009527 [Micractinium tetrahymenae]